MANVIKHKRGSGSDPTASDLVVGEVAIRTDVGKLFTKMDNGSVAEIAGGGSDIAINTLSASSSGSGASSFNSSENRFQLSSPPSVSAQQLLVSVNGVIQKPVPGTGTPSEGFSVDGNDIIFSSPPETGADFFILTFKSLGVSEPADNSVTSAKIVDGAIVNADINASAAIAGTKIDPSFTSDITITNTQPKISLVDTNANDDFEIKVNAGNFAINDATNSANRFKIDSSGTVDIDGNLDVGAGLDVTGGDITGSGDLILSSGQIRATDSIPAIFTNAVTGTTPCTVQIGNNTHTFAFTASSSGFSINDFTNVNAQRLFIDTSGNVGIGTNSPGQKLDVSGNINTTGELRFNSAARRVFYRPGNNDMIFEAAANFFYMQDIANTAHKWFTNSGDVRLLIQANGHIGIGTTTAGERLQVNGAIDFTGGATTNIASSGKLSFESGTAFLQSKGADTSTRGKIGFNIAHSDGSSGLTAMSIDADGKVGIGLTTPQSQLELSAANGTIMGIQLGRAGDLITASRYIGICQTNNPTNLGTNSGFSGVEFGGPASSGEAYLAFHTHDAGVGSGERFRIDKTGNIVPADSLNVLSTLRTQGQTFVKLTGHNTSNFSVMVFGVNSGGHNTGSCAVALGKHDTNNRSLNAAGTVNASGNDYAEYMTKSSDFTLAKGDICGIDANGKLTNKFSESISFVVKSTDPSYVGGDAWGTEEVLGEKPADDSDDLPAYEEKYEAARKMVDRIAFSGQVPVNVTGTTPGQHIIPTASSGDAITGVAKAEKDLSITEYMSSIGKVIALEPDGRAKIIVKVA